MNLSHLERARFKTAPPFDITFTILRVRPRTVLIYDEQQQRERVLPRAVVERALREQALIYLGVARARARTGVASSGGAWRGRAG